MDVMPWLRRTRKAYSRLEQNGIKLFARLVAVRWSVTITSIKYSYVVILSVLRRGSLADVLRSQEKSVLSTCYRFQIAEDHVLAKASQEFEKSLLR